jgi:alpha-galactosidase
MMGSHVGASPAHATGRAQALAFRAAVAMPGHFGVEMDPRTLDGARAG